MAIWLFWGTLALTLKGKIDKFFAYFFSSVTRVTRVKLGVKIFFVYFKYFFYTRVTLHSF